MGGIQNFKKHKAFCFGIGLIVWAGIFLGALFYSVNIETIASVQILNNQNMQDFYFIPDISEEDIIDAKGSYEEATQKINDELATKYDFKWENHNYKYLEDEFTIRSYKADRKIDTLLVEQGEMPKDGEVIVNNKFFEENAFELGDKISISDEIYKISGTAFFPDMIYPQVTNSGSGYDAKNESLVAMTDKDYESLDGNESIAFVGRFDKDYNLDEMRDDNSFLFLISSDENLNILSMVDSKIKIHNIILAVIVGIFSAIIVFMVVLLLLRMMREEMPQLGILKALGYTSWELARSYLSVGIIFVVAFVLAIITTYAVEPAYVTFFNEILEIPKNREAFPFARLSIVCFIVIVFFVVVTLLTAIIYLRKSALVLIKNNDVKKTKSRSQKINNKVNKPKFLDTIRIIQMRTSISAVILVAVAGFSLGTMLQLSFTMGNIPNNLSDDVVRGLKYKNDVRFIESNEEKQVDGIPYYGVSARLCGKDGNDLAGVELYMLLKDDPSILTLKNEAGEEIRTDNIDGVIINHWMEHKYDIAKGDELIFNIDGESYKIKVAEISDAIYGNTIYFSMLNAIDANIIGEEKFNGVLTNKTDYEDTVFQISIEEVKQNIMNTNSIYVVAAIICLLCGLAIGIPLLILSFMNIINDSRKNIAMLETIGYTKKESNHIMIDGYRIAAYLGLIISIPYTYMVGKLLFSAISKASTMIFSLYINMASITVTVIGTVILIEILIRIFRQSMSKITYKELIES